MRISAPTRTANSAANADKKCGREWRVRTAVASITLRSPPAYKASSNMPEAGWFARTQ
jgi:hypothetical protein